MAGVDGGGIESADPDVVVLTLYPRVASRFHELSTLNYRAFPGPWGREQAPRWLRASPIALFEGTPFETAEVQVHYVGTLLSDGSQFDSSRSRHSAARRRGDEEGARRWRSARWCLR